MLQNATVIAEGKTKILTQVHEGSHVVYITSKDDLTAGDGAKHDLLVGKAELANKTTCNVFRFLKKYGIPTAFIKEVDDKTFSAFNCNMLPYEVVVRGEAMGSYLKRMPDVAKGYVFPKPLVEFFLKTNDRKWKGYNLPCDDPLMVHFSANAEIYLYEPSKRYVEYAPFLTLNEEEVFQHADEAELFNVMADIAKRVFGLLKQAWHQEGGRLVDFKLEFGLDHKGELLLADVIDNDSWRVIYDNVHVDKQAYREGGGLEDVLEKYRKVAEITSRF